MMENFDQHLCVSADDWKVAMRDFEQAIDGHSKVIDLDVPTNRVHFSNRSAAYLSNHDATQALADAEKCIHMNPSLAKGYEKKGAALYQLGDFDNSINAYKEGLGVDPDSTHLKKGLADVQKSAQRYTSPSPESLVAAAYVGDLPGINALLRMGCGVNETIKRLGGEFTPLGMAVEGQQEGAVKLLLAAGADPNLAQHGSAGPMPPIFMPVKFGRAGLVELLVKAGASVHGRFDADQWTLLHVAASKGHLGVVRVLLAAGARLDVRTKDGRLPITVAMDKGHAGVVELLIKAGASVHEPVDKDQLTLLHLTCHVEVARVLLAAGARVDAPAMGQGFTPLHMAACEGKVEVARVLLAAGARLDALAKNGACSRSPVSFAAQYGHAGVVELLINAGASVQEHVEEQQTLLHVAAIERHVEVARVLLAAGARVDALTKDGRTPLLSCLDMMLATTAEGLAAVQAIVKLLIKAGADVNARETGRPPRFTVLHAAAVLCCPGIVQDLLDAGAKIDAKDMLGLAPEMCVSFLPHYGDPKSEKQVADTKAVFKRWKKTQAAGGGGKQRQQEARTERGGIAVGSSGGAGAGAGAGASGSSLVLKGHCSGEVQDKKKKKKKKKRAVREENRVCDGPDCSSLGVNRCKACKRPAYCGVECQRAHWNAGHKQECKIWRE